MTPHWRRGLMVACLLGAPVTACGQPQDATPETGGRCAAGFAAPFDRVDACSAEAVMIAGLRTVFSYRPAEQGDERAAFRQAEALMDPNFASHAEPAATVLPPITARVWQHWAEGGIAIVATVRVGADDHPPDTAVNAARVLQVTQQPSDASPAIEFPTYVRAQRDSAAGAWRITALEVRT
ncbi:hypothetical protein K7711_36535 [Nocardia sp. CA2R105]|uniref:hypothetical protein n=1 Tax=Nocardia coffeae TaxID=2873381 RepID=UPI001CA62FBA|nr:hypothetical protein [Nocardia coffeae]MBY8862032.1 hypothetical protein [Nocardia coffeae]